MRTVVHDITIDFITSSLSLPRNDARRVRLMHRGDRMLRYNKYSLTQPYWVIPKADFSSELQRLTIANPLVIFKRYLTKIKEKNMFAKLNKIKY